MNVARILALASRIIRQVLRDRRTLALIFIAPLLVMTLLYVVLTNTSSLHTLALVRPSGQGSDRIDTLIDNLLPGKDKLKTINIRTDQVDATLRNGDADASVQGVPSTPVGNIPFTVNDPRYLYGGPQYTFNDSIAPVFIGIFSFFFVFLLTSVAFLRERSQGTIERVMASPLTRAELVIGYVCGFTMFALIQSLVILLFVVFALQVHYSGNLALVFLVSVLLTIGSVNLGIFLSTFAQNEFQIVQFMPLVFGIQVFLSGIFWPIAQLPALLRPISYVLPLTYANDALRGVMLKGDSFSEISGQLMALVVFALLMVLLSSLTVRRQIA